MYLCVYLYIYISVVTGLTKIRKITDYGFFEPSTVPRCPLHADHFGINGIEIQEHEKTKITDARIRSGSDPTATSDRESGPNAVFLRYFLSDHI